MDELIDIVDKDNNLLNFQRMKSKAHEVGLWHRAAHIIIYHNDSILLQQRVDSKDYFPGVWDISAAGHIGAGEIPVESALRELQEEVGIKSSVEELNFYKIIKEEHQYKNINNKEFYYMYFLKREIDLDNLTLQKEEVKDVKIMKLDDLEKDLKKNPKDYFPHKYWDEIIQKVKSYQ